MNKAQMIAEPGKQEIRVTRVFDAPRELLFKALTDPALVPQWWGQRNSNLTVDKMEVRKGGIWRYVERDVEGNEYAFSGVYHAIVPGEQVISTFEFEPLPGHHVILETMKLSDEDGKTRLSVTSVFQSVEDRDGMLQSGMEGGMNESYDRLDELIAQLQKA